MSFDIRADMILTHIILKPFVQLQTMAHLNDTEICSQNSN